jgi:hypothetical protein
MQDECYRRSEQGANDLGQFFACRDCHDLTYTSVQKHDARLDRLLKPPDWILMDLIKQDSNLTMTILAIRAGYIKLGLISKY